MAKSPVNPEVKIDINQQQGGDKPFSSTTASSAPIILSWSNVSFSIPQKVTNKLTGKQETIAKTLLSNISGCVEPGQVVAIMGASGAGKSTLLNVLAGRISNVGILTGEISINGSPRNPINWKKQVCYVEQDDLMYENLSVRETLEYAALLRLPRTLPVAEKQKRVDSIIQQLGLGKCEQSRIGGAGKRGISGGERKRLSIGIELVTEPSLLFLDEPSSGLDAFTCLSILETIKQVAVERKCTVLMTIHQPREQLLELFDGIILLSEGKLVYTGHVSEALQQFSKCGFTCPPRTNPSDFFLDTMTIDFRSEELRLRSLDRMKLLQDTWETEHAETAKSVSIVPATAAHKETKYWNNSFIFESYLLLQRSFKDMLRDPAVIGSTFGQSIVNMLLLGFVFFKSDDTATTAGIQNRFGAFFFIVVNMSFGYVMPTIAVFTQQREIIKRERASGTYRASSAYLAKLFSQLPLTVLATLIFVIPVYWMIGLDNNLTKFGTYLVICVVHGVTMTIMGIMISAGVPNVRVGQIIAPLFIGIFLVFGGLLVNLNSTPNALAWIKWISVIQYSYSALSRNEFTGLEFNCPGKTCITGEQVLETNALDSFPSLWYNVLINGCICLCFVVLGFLLFKSKSQPLLRLK